MKVLIIEDEDALRENLQQELSQKGYVVETAKDGREGQYQALEYPYDALIVDLGLPHISGLDLIQAVREQGKSTPVLVLTARGQWQDKVKALELGADDYVVKPFHFEELFARLNALIRRTGGWSQPQLKCGPISLDTITQLVKVEERSIDLTAYEYKVLEYLMMNPGKIVSKTELTEHLYSQDFDRDSNVIEVFVGRLRKKLALDDTLKPIETIRGRGYRFSLTPDEDGAG